MTYKTLILTVVIFVLLGIGLGFFFFRTPPTSTQSEGTSKTPENSTPDFFPSSSDSSMGVETGRPQSSTANGATTLVATGTASNAQTKKQNLRELVSRPVSGAAVIERNKQSLVRYMERETGHISELALDEKVSAKVTGTTIPKTFRTLWGEGGESLIVQLFADKANTVATVFARIDRDTASSTASTTRATLSASYSKPVAALDGTVLPREIRELSVSPDRKKAFYLLASGTGVVGVTSGFNQSSSPRGQTVIFESAVSEWLTQWAATETIAFTSKAAADVPGYLYYLSPTTKRTEKVLDAIPGLTTLVSPDAKFVVYSQGKGRGLATYLYTLTKHDSQAFPVQTLPEKCVFARLTPTVFCAVPTTIFPARYPDAWYKGLLGFNDGIWSINLETSEAKLLANPSSVRRDQTVDGIDLQLNEAEDMLLFTNKRDGHLWVLSLE